MKRNRLNLHDQGKSKTASPMLSKVEGGSTGSTLSFAIARSGDWLPVEELHEKALAAVREGGDVVLNLEGVDHLDASAFQILLALNAEQKKQGRTLRCQNASSSLQHSFQYAGANHNILGSEGAKQ